MAYYNRYQPKSAGLSVMDAAASRGNFVDGFASRASSEYGPRTKRLANLHHYKEGKSGSHLYLKNTGMGPKVGLMHSHDYMRKYNKNVKSGIAAHKAVYGGDTR